jgi:hypothetical protein
MNFPLSFFLGFICTAGLFVLCYILVIGAKTLLFAVKKFLPKKELPVPVEKNDGVNQVLVSISNLRVRTGASTDASVLGMCAQGYFNVLEIVKDSSYSWYKIGASA